MKLKDKYKGRRCFVIGNGPSLTKEDLESLKDEITFAANRINLMFEHTNWRPNYYVCIDYDLYSTDCKKINQIEADLRFVPLERAIAAGQVYPDITYYHRRVNPTHLDQGKVLLNAECNFSEDCENIVYGAETVLYDAIQWAVYMGFSEIYLLGVDCSFTQEMSTDGDIIVNEQQEHFDDDSYGANLDTSQPVAVFVMLQAYQKAKEVCERRGIIIKNATRGGKLEVFERIDLDLLLK